MQKAKYGRSPEAVVTTKLVPNAEGVHEFVHAITGPIVVDRKAEQGSLVVRWHPDEGAVCIHFHEALMMVGLRPVDAALLSRQLLSAAVQGGLPLDQAFPVLGETGDFIKGAGASKKYAGTNARACPSKKAAANTGASGSSPG